MIEAKRNHYYVAEVKVTQANWKHRTIVMCIDEEDELFEFPLYDGFVMKHVKELNYFEIISEIEEMREDFIDE